MEQIYLIVDLGRNAVVNQDGLTLLRELYLVQGTTYNVYLAFQNNGASMAAPTMANFAFTVSLNGELFSSVFLTASGNASYPLCFTVLPASTALETALAGKGLTDCNGNAVGGSIKATGLLSWSSGNTNTALAPFSVRVQNGVTGSLELDYTTSINKLTGNITLTGTDGISVATDDSGTITVGSSPIAPNIYATPTTAETQTLTPSLANYWYVDATLSPATFNLPDATTVPGITYTFLKTAGSLNNTLTVNCASGQQIKSFSRLAVSNNGGTVAISKGVFYDASLYVIAIGDSITLTAVPGGWITDDFTGDVV